MDRTLKKGHTLLEIVIAVAVFGLVASAVAFVFTRALVIYQNSDQKKEAMQDAQIAKEWLVRDLDATSCIVQAEATTLKLNSDLGKISYTLQTSSVPYKLMRSANAVNYVLAENIDSLTFKYFNSANQEVPPDIEMVQMTLRATVDEQSFDLYTVAPVYTNTFCTSVDAYGWTGYEYFKDFAQTEDGGYIVAGYTNSYAAYGNDILLMKLSAFGDVEWVKTYGQAGSITDYAERVIVLSDGYLVSGYTYSGSDRYAVLLRTDLNGNISGAGLWYKVYKYNGSGNQFFAMGLQEAGNGFIMAGHNFRSSLYNAFVLKVSKDSGTVSYSKSYGDTGVSGDYCIQDFQADADGNYLMVGTASCYAGGSANKVLLMKVNPKDGSIVTGTAYTYELGTSQDYGYRIIPDPVNGGYLLGAAKLQTVVIKLSSSFSVDWARYFTGSNYMFGLQQVAGGYLILGRTTGSPYDAVLINIDPDGVTVPWKYSYGGASDDFPGRLLKIELQGNEAYLVGGYTNSYGRGLYDVLLFRTGSTGTIDQCSGANFVKTTASFAKYDQSVTPAYNASLAALNYPMVTVALTIYQRNLDIATQWQRTVVCPCEGCS